MRVGLSCEHFTLTLTLSLKGEGFVGGHRCRPYWLLAAGG